MVIGGIGKQEPGSGKCLKKTKWKKYSAYEFEKEGNLLMRDHKKGQLPVAFSFSFS